MASTAPLGEKVFIGMDKRNGIVKMWQFVPDDLKNLGSQTFIPKFCHGSPSHVSIR